MAKVAVYIDRNMQKKRWKYGLNAFEGYITEILSHVGIPFRQIGMLEESDLDQTQTDVLIVALEDDDPAVFKQIWQFAESGGAVISYGGLDKLAEPLGCIRHRLCNEAYAFLPGELGDTRPLRALKVKPWVAQDKAPLLVEQYGAIAAYHPEGEKKHSVLQKFIVGKGSIDRFSVDIPLSVFGFQQGFNPILADGFPAPDGTAKIDEHILKADDGINMDWEFDRLHTASGQSYFAHPYADLWREVCIGHLIKTALSLGLTLPLIGYWPSGIKSVAMISHDSDGNLDEHAISTLKVLKEDDVQTTWCMLEPGYSEHLYNSIREAGHELAFHYNALESQGGIWNGEELQRQLDWLRQAAQTGDITTNKNHFTRFEGWGELFQWSEQMGIEVDQTRGPSKGGNVGFIFGTCHAFFPMAWSDECNRFYDVIEIGFLTQDLDLGMPWADSSVITPFLEQVMRVKGIAHFLFHQTHIHSKPSVVKALHRFASEARELGFTFWTSKQINEWERRRRKVSIEGMDGAGQVLLKTEAEVDDIVVWIPLDKEAPLQEDVEIQFGVHCSKQVGNYGQNSIHTLSIQG